MWTGDGRVFFYNPSSRISVWDRPNDLLNRQDVDKMVSNPADSMANTKNAQPNDSSSDSSDDDHPPAKKTKHEVSKGSHNIP